MGKIITAICLILILFLSILCCMNTPMYENDKTTQTADCDTQCGGATLTVPTQRVETEVEIMALSEPIDPTGDELIECCNMIAKTIYGEARGETKTEQAAVVWCILNRVDSDKFPNTIQAVIKQPHQFSGYKRSNPVWKQHFDVAFDVLMRWKDEKTNGTLQEESGRVLPSDYLFFAGWNGSNRFRKGFRSTRYWNWELESPY